MNYNLQLLIITHLLIAANSCTAMKLASIAEPKILMELTCIEKPRNALYLAENRVLINGDKQCSIVDPNADQEIKRIFDKNGWSSCISVHPNKHKFAFSTHYPPNYNQKITIYNVKTDIAEHTISWDRGSIKSLPFSPLDDTIAISEINAVDVTLYNYKTNKTTIINIAEALPETLYFKPVISFHPTQPLMCLAWKNIYIHNLETSVTVKKPGDCYYHDFCEYSPDGSFIAIGNTAQITIMKPDLLVHRSVTAQQARNSFFNNMAIHPNSKVLITLSRSTEIVQYWNIETCELIASMSILSNSAEYCRSSLSLSFSPNGTKLLLVLYGECTIFAVPFEALYKGITKDKSIFTYLALQHFLYDKKNTLPKEICLLLIQHLLATSQY